PYRHTIYFLGLLITLGPHDPLSRTLQLHIPSTYTPAEARAMLDHSNDQLRLHPTRTFTPLPISHNSETHTLHVDLTADALCLNNLEDASTLRLLPRGRSLPDVLPCLQQARHLAVPWTLTPFPVPCRRCGDHALRETLPGRNPVCPRSSNRSVHAWEQQLPEELHALWPGQFPALERVYFVVDTGRFPGAVRLKRGETPDNLPESEFLAPRGMGYDVDSDDWV
ncbi:hypothetical protein C8A01DRAFT_12666, partial [Parachaetomium inaequale]